MAAFTAPGAALAAELGMFAVSSRVLIMLLVVVSAGACSSPTTDTTSIQTPPTQPVVIVDVTPVEGEPCSYLAREEIEAAAGLPIVALTVTGESCIWSFPVLTSGEYAGESPNLRLGIERDSDRFDSVLAESAAATIIPIADLGDDAFARSGDGVSDGETFVLAGNMTVVVVFQLMFANFDDQAAVQETLARLVLSRL